MVKVLRVTTLMDNSTPGDGLMSLREAIEEANATAGETRINFAGSLRDGTIYLDDYLEVTGGNITIDGDINNDGFNDITISGDTNTNGIADAADSRLLVVRAGGTVTFDYVNFVDAFYNNAGEPGERAAAITNLGGTLTISNGLVGGNRTVGTNSDVATIFNGAAGTLTVEHTLFAENTATVAGGFAAVSGILNKGTLNADKLGFDGIASGGAGSTVGIQNDGSLSNGGNPILIGLGAGGTGVTGGATDPVQTGVSGSMFNDALLEIDGVNQTVALGFANDDLINVTGGASTIFGGHGEDVVMVRPLATSVTYYGGTGADQIDLSFSQLVGATLDLRISTVQDVTAGFQLLIQGVEDAFGTPNGDMLIGNAQDNKIAGQGGSDTIYGYAGKDRLFASIGGTDLAPVVIHGGGGADLINFRIGTAVIDGAGTGAVRDMHLDTFSFADSGLGGVIDLRRTDKQEVSSETFITMTGIESLLGSNYDDVLTGTNAKNRLVGVEGDDIINGLGGKDEIFGGDGLDTIAGGDGIDRLDGGSDDDLVRAGRGDDSASGGSGNDRVFGGIGNDVLRGDLGNDKIYGEAGNDQMNGDAGNDQMFGAAGDDKALGGLGNDLIRLGVGNDEADGGDGNDRVFGGIGNDKLTGGKGIDRLFGDAGADTLNGGNGKDTLNGGAGKDIMIGGAGPDTFVLRGNSGQDLIRDFVIGVDKMDLDASLSFASLTISQVGSDALVEFGTNSVRLQGIDGDDLSGSDFLF